MKKSVSILKRVFVSVLAAVMTAGTGWGLNFGNFIGISINANAVQTFTAQDFQYKKSNNTITITKYLGSGQKVVIPNEIDGLPVTVIGSYAFQNCTGLTGVEIPNSISTIEFAAFRNCSALSNVHFQDNSSLSLMESAVFKNCTSLNEITLSNGIPWIGFETFSGCTSLTGVSVPDSVTAVCENAFYGCINLADITIPDNVETIDNRAFYQCTSLTNIVLPDSVTRMGYMVFFGCENLKSVRLSKSLNSIGTETFEDCTSLADITMPNGLKGVSAGLFSNCTSLAKMSLPDGITYIDDDAFLNCTNLRNINIPNSVTQIGDKAFYNCTNLTSVTLPDDLYFYETSFNKNGLTIYCCKDSRAEYYAKKYNISFQYLLTNTSSLSAEKIALGETVTVNAGAECGKADYTYAVYYKKTTDKKWIEAQKYSSVTTLDITPDLVAEYDVCVKVKDTLGSIAKKYFTVLVSPLENVSSISASSVICGDTITVNAKAAGGKGRHTYAVYYKKDTDTKWTEKQAYNTNSTVPITFGRVGFYRICVKVKDKNGTVVKKYFDIRSVKDNLTNNSAYSIQDRTVTVYCGAKNGISPYYYAVYYKKTSDSKWIEVQPYSLNSTVRFTPSSAGNYNICIKAKDARNKIKKLYFVAGIQ